MPYSRVGQQVPRAQRVTSTLPRAASPAMRSPRPENRGTWRAASPRHAAPDRARAEREVRSAAPHEAPRHVHGEREAQARDTKPSSEDLIIQKINELERKMAKTGPLRFRSLVV